MEKKEKIENLTTINFSITKCPVRVFKRFSQFCKDETNDNYSFGLKMLLDAMDGNVKEALLFEQYIELKARVEGLEAKKGEETPRSKPKTLGSKHKTN